MGLVIFLLKWITYVSTFLFATVCLATGLYYIAEIVEDYEKTTRKIIKYTTWGVLVAHVLVFISEPVPWHVLLVGFLSHLSYLNLLRSFPYIRSTSPSLILSGVCCVLSQILWFLWLRSTWYPFEEVCAFFFILVWLVPFIYFISISSNDTALPYGATISATGEVVEGEKGRHSFIHNIGQTIIGFIRKDTSSSDYNRLKYQ